MLAAGVPVVVFVVVVVVVLVAVALAANATVFLPLLVVAPSLWPLASSAPRGLAAFLLPIVVVAASFVRP